MKFGILLKDNALHSEAPGGQSAVARLRWPLLLATERCAGVLVVVAAGRLSHQSAAVLGTALEAAISGEPGGLVLDLGQVDYMSSAGLEIIDKAAQRLKRAKGLLVLCGLQEPVQVALELAGLDASIAIEPSRERAAARIAETAGSAPSTATQ